MTDTDVRLNDPSRSADDLEISQALLNQFDRAALARTAKSESWQRLVAPFRSPDTWRSTLQYIGNLFGIVASDAAGLYSLHHVPWLTPLFVLLLAGFLVRFFITFHDCGHGSYFKSQRWNDRAGIVAGFFISTPYYAWRKAHAIHHATAGDLDRRGTGDIPTLTVDEYLALSPRQQFNYRLARHPLVVFFGGAVLLFIILQRFTTTWGFRKEDALQGREVRNIHVTTIASALVFALVWAIGGWPLLLFVHLPAAIIAAGTGIVLFYVQHQFEGVYWRRHDDWSYLRGSIDGSSWLQLPKVLQFFTGNIGVHHIHHLAPKVPNYKLQRCADSSPFLREGVKILGLREAYRSLWLTVYDEPTRTLIGWRDLEGLLAARRAAAGGLDPSSGAAESG